MQTTIRSSAPPPTLKLTVSAIDEIANHLSNPRALQLTRAFGLAALAMVVVALFMVFFIAPRGELRAGGDAQRIFYFHLSSVWVGFLGWIVTAICGIRYLKTRDLKFDRVAVSSAEIGMVFLSMGLLTGMIWARPTWNTWWTWDFKLTLSLLQIILYVAYLVLRTGVDEPDKRARFAAVYGIVGVLTVPLNFLVSRVLNSIHPAVFGPSVNGKAQGQTGVAPEMMPILIFSLIAFTLVYLYFVRSRIAIQERMDVIAAKRSALIAE